jgi:Protein of unknown function (DUF1579)
MTRIATCVAMLSICTVALAAQAPPAPKPSAEHQKLGAFVGNWTFVGELKAGPMGPGGKLTGTDRIQWLADNFAVERRFEGKSPMGAMNGLEVIAYDSAKKVYTYSIVDSTGAVGSGTATNSGSTWTFTGNGSMAGHAMQERCTLTFGAGNATLKIACESSSDGKSFAPMIEGTATRTK